MEPRGETPGGMPLYQRDGRTIPQSSRHEEEVDGLDGKQSLRAVLRTLIKIYTFAPNFKFGTK